MKKIQYRQLVLLQAKEIKRLTKDMDRLAQDVDRFRELAFNRYADIKGLNQTIESLTQINKKLIEGLR